MTFLIYSQYLNNVIEGDFVPFINNYGTTVKKEL